MKIAKSGLAALLLVGSLVGSAMAQDDGVILKQELEPGSNYCNIQMRAVRPITLGWTLRSSTMRTVPISSISMGRVTKPLLARINSGNRQFKDTVGQTTILTKAVNGVKRRALALLTPAIMQIREKGGENQ